MQAFFTTQGGASTTFFSLVGSGTSGTETTVAFATSEDITVTRIAMWVDVAPGGATSCSLTFRDDAANTAAAVTISGAATSGSWTGSVSVAALSNVCLSAATAGGTPATGTWYCIVEYTTTGDFYLLPMVLASNPSTSATGFMNPGSAGGGATSTTATDRQLITPTAGNFTKLTAALTTAPGASKSYAVSLRKANTTDSLTATVTGAASTVVSTTGSTAMAAGDAFTIKIVPSGTPTSSPLKVCLTVAPTTPGEIILSGNGTALSAVSGTVQYNQFFVANQGWFTGGEFSLFHVVPAGTISALNVKLTVAPASGKSRTFTFRQNLADSALVTTISNTAVANSDTTHSVTTADGDKISMKAVPSSTAATAIGQYSLVFVYPPVAGATGKFFPFF